MFPVEPSQETSPDQEQDSFMTPQTSHPKVSTTTRDVTIQGIRAEAAVVVTEKAVDLRVDPKSFSATFTAAIRTIQPTSV